MILVRLVLNRAVRQYMADNGISLRRMAKTIGLAPTSLTDRLNGRIAWRDRDIDQLVNRGIVSPLWEGDERWRVSPADRMEK